eukprot:sb/3463993/
MWRQQSDVKYVSVQLSSEGGAPTVTGRYVHTDRGRVAAFTGIPYAEPPINERRFSLPVRKTFRIGDKISATSPPNSCLQILYPPFPFFVMKQTNIHEDCLYLNVFTKKPWLSSPSLHPVIVYIHGGSFSNGDGISRDGSALTDHGEVVLVTINYRLGLLGFPDLPGVTPNLGLWDVVMALQWVQDNIGVFGGDKDNVTLLGESAGGALVTYLHTSPLTGALFARSIALSGTQIAPWAHNKRRSKEEVEKWPKILEMTKCEQNSVCCLRNLTGYDIYITLYKLLEFFPVDTWPPMVDGILVTSDPVDALNEGLFIDLKVTISILTLLSLLVKDTLTRKQFRDLSVDNPFNQNGTFPCMSDNGDALVELYPAKGGKKMKEQYARFMGDWLLTCPQFSTAEIMSEVGYSVYQYTFNYHWDSALPDTESWMGTLHGFDLAFIFGLPFSTHSPYTIVSNSQFNKRDRAMSRSMMGIISSFAHTGVPSAQIDISSGKCRSFVNCGKFWVVSL